MAVLLYLCLLAAMVAKPVAPMTTTQSPYLVVEDNGDTMEDTEGTIEDTDEAMELPSCEAVMANNGLNFSSFWHGAAHGIHSLYLEEIREWFEPEATVDNKIPVVNENLSADHTILFDAPLAGYDEDFQTMALKVMSYFMLNDAPDFATQGLNTLEKLTHQYHMHEIYAAAAPIYRRMKENPPTDPELCPCVNDITGNGILTEMVNIAKQLKYFGSKRKPRACGGSSRAYLTYRTYGCDWHDTFAYDNGPVPTQTRDQPQLQQQQQQQKQQQPLLQQRGKRSTDNVTQDEISRLKQEYLADSSHENAVRLLEAAPWKPNSLVGSEQWIIYEAMLTKSMLEEEELNDFATFMYCKLNQPELDHPKELFD